MKYLNLHGVVTYIDCSVVLCCCNGRDIRVVIVECYTFYECISETKNKNNSGRCKSILALHLQHFIVGFAVLHFFFIRSKGSVF